jgi:hypothetical protein
MSDKSGWRCLGSSGGNDKKFSVEVECVSLIMVAASYRMENSTGLPKFKGPAIDSDVTINRAKA